MQTSWIDGQCTDCGAPSGLEGSTGRAPGRWSSWERRNDRLRRPWLPFKHGVSMHTSCYKENITATGPSDITHGCHCHRLWRCLSVLPRSVGKNAVGIRRQKPRGRPHLLYQRPDEDAAALSELGYYQDPGGYLQGNPCSGGAGPVLRRPLSSRSY